VSETKEGILNFFNGAKETVEVDGVLVEVRQPGYLELLDRPYAVTDGGMELRYRNSPERMGNLDESYLCALSVKRGVTAKGQKMAGAQGGGHVQPITFIGGLTFTGRPLIEGYITQGKHINKTICAKAHPTAIHAYRPDGYVMTPPLMKNLLATVAENVPGV
jgi:hypothetical protein